MLLLGVVVLFVLGIVPLLRILWIFSGLILLAMLVYFIYSAMKLSAKYQDWSAMRLVVLYFVRSVAWFVGAVNTTWQYLTRRNK